MANQKPAKAFNEAAKRLISLAVSMGWTAAHTANRHLKFTKDGCPTVFGSGTPSDHRAWRNTLAKLRRADKECDQCPT